ncbi:MAG: sugar phosphate isomerase/epimerase [Verrucomicrobiota bacterium]|nr:sugar phosphate isomerase/epimerase [Verrucomicrobiota bacterium]
MSPPILSRRSFLSTTATAVAAAAAGLHQRLQAAEAGAGVKGRVNHSVCKWCYPKVGLEELCKAGKEMGLASVELLQPSDFPVLEKYGLICAMTSNPTARVPEGKPLGTIERAFNRKEHHDLLAQAYEPQINAVAEAGFNNLICFSGNREGLDDETGLKNCAEGLKRLLPLAEKKGVVLCMELLNSKVNHKDYMCDHTAWGVELCKLIGSEHFKLLYDIYHMQIMEGDVIATIRANQQYLAHYHTGGVPGRHEIDETQELNYPAIMRAIVETGFKGHVAQEFIPARPEPLASLKQAVGICNV